MTDLPAPVQEYLLGIACVERKLAFLQIGKEGQLEGVGGCLEFFGLESLGWGDVIVERAPYLHGLLPVQSGSVLPEVEVASRRYAQIHLFEADNSSWVLLLDHTSEAMGKVLLQQRINELSIDAERAAYETTRSRKRTGEGVLAAGEKLELTVLQCRLKGLEALSERITPDRALRTVRHFVKLALEGVRSGSGHLVELRGTSVVAVFGVEPETTLGPVRAIEAAFRISRAAREMHPSRQRTPEMSLGTGIGIVTGEVAVGSFGQRTWRHLACVGRPMQQVAVLEQAASPWEVVVDHGTFERAEGLQNRFVEKPLAIAGQPEDDRVFHCSVRS